LSVERSHGSQKEEAAEAVVLVSFVDWKSRPSWCCRLMKTGTGRPGLGLWAGDGGRLRAVGLGVAVPVAGLGLGKGFSENGLSRARGYVNWGSGLVTLEDLVWCLLGGGLDPSTKGRVP
jgi:hypothetical protein